MVCVCRALGGGKPLQITGTRLYCILSSINVCRLYKLILRPSPNRSDTDSHSVWFSVKIFSRFARPGAGGGGHFFSPGTEPIPAAFLVYVCSMLCGVSNALGHTSIHLCVKDNRMNTIRFIWAILLISLTCNLVHSPKNCFKPTVLMWLTP
jgi:hypothetical protein